jgi:hypothetical protein
MIKGIKGKRLATAPPNKRGYAILFAFFCILVGFFVNFGHAAKFTEHGAMNRLLIFLVIFLIWLVIFWYFFLPSMVFFHENGFHCVGLESAEADLSGEGRLPWRERFWHYEDVEYAFQQIDEEIDEGDVEEHLKGKFIFRIAGTKYNFRAWVVNPEALDELLVEHLGDRYMGAVVQNVDG